MGKNRRGRSIVEWTAALVRPNRAGTLTITARTMAGKLNRTTE